MELESSIPFTPDVMIMGTTLWCSALELGIGISSKAN
jgi:hypothetical protein